MRRRRLGNLHIKANGQVLRGIAGGVVAGLVFEDAAHDVFARFDGAERVHGDIDVEIAGINVEFLVRSESKAHILSFRVNDLAYDNVGGGIDLKGSGDQKLRLGVVGIDVVAAGDIEREGHGSRFGLNRGDNVCGRHFDDGALGTEFLLGRSQGSHQNRIR